VRVTTDSNDVVVLQQPAWRYLLATQENCATAAAQFPCISGSTTVRQLSYSSHHKCFPC
jgi:hypothetical protein